MNGADLVALLPLLLVAAGSILVMLAAAIRRSHALSAGLTAATLVAALVSVRAAAPLAPRHVTPLLVVDGYALYYLALVVAGSLAVALFAYGYLERQGGERDEFYVLLLVSTLGSGVLVCSRHFASFFLGLEVLSVGLYALIAYFPDRPRPVEAGLKYLVLASTSAAFLLFGMALVYAAFGTMDFDLIAEGGAPGAPGGTGVLVVAGAAMIVTGIGFKLAVVPFHMWTPDVYEGAPAPVSALVATVSKGGMFALLLRYFSPPGVFHAPALGLVLAIIAVASMVAGNLLALRQDNVKRVLAYSSIAHLGYFLVALLAGGPLGPKAATFYLAAYFVTILGAFGVVSMVSPRGRDADLLEDYRGLFWRQPVLGGVLSAMLFSLAGIPLTAGFVGKFYVVLAGAATAAWPLVLTLVITSAIGLFYYLRVLVVLYERTGARGVEDDAGAAAANRGPQAGRRPGAPAVLALACLTALLLWLGASPSFFLDGIDSAMPASHASSEASGRGRQNQ